MGLFPDLFSSGNDNGDHHDGDDPLLSPLPIDDDSFQYDTNTTTTNSLQTAEEEHNYDAITTVCLNIILILCVLGAYAVKRFRLYCLPESVVALLIGILTGGLAKAFIADDASALHQVLLFDPELFFFVFLPPIIFEAGYSLNHKDFFRNIGAITLFAMVGTLISTFTVGYMVYYAATNQYITVLQSPTLMEALLFGSLISAVDPVATLSIMGNAELNCDRLLYSLVFGESVLNDAIAISLFKVFSGYVLHEDDDSAETPTSTGAAVVQFLVVSLCSVLVGVGLGLLCSAVYRHTRIGDYVHLETSLLFLFCYLCYSSAEAIGLSGIMALFWMGIVLQHYNSYNLSPEAHAASEHIFCMLATLAETAVFVYMGIEVFDGRFALFDWNFAIFATFACLVGRFLNIFPLACVANMCRKTPETAIPWRMQIVLWFAGLRGAIAFCLAVNLPGPNAEYYVTTTLFICILTTVVCGSLTNSMLTCLGMKQSESTTIVVRHKSSPDPNGSRPKLTSSTSQRVYKGAKLAWKKFDNEVLKPAFGGKVSAHRRDGRGEYELSRLTAAELHDSDDEEQDGLRAHSVPVI